LLGSFEISQTRQDKEFDIFNVSFITMCGSFFNNKRSTRPHCIDTLYPKSLYLQYIDLENIFSNNMSLKKKAK